MLLALSALGAEGRGCDETIDPVAPPAAERPVVDERWEELVKDGAAPAGIDTQNSNNNLDVVRFGGRTFLAWRTAPTHFASDQTVLWVASEGPDGWREEGSFALGTDVREPRFLVLGDRLLLYFAVLGSDPFKFEPQGAKVSVYHGPGDWESPADVYEPGFIPWRARTIDGKAYVIGYTGGENIYAIDGEPIAIHFLTTKDGLTLEPVVPGKPVVQTGGGSETDFAFLDDGSLVAVTRNEAGDAAFGFGSKICRAPKEALADWTCAPDPKKYDSPLVFRSGPDVWLVGRRNVTDDGRYDLGASDLSLEDQANKYEVEYSFKPKRCALWRVDPEALTVTFARDLPSRGDTCFPSVLPEDEAEGRFTIYNYSNLLDGAPDCAAWPDACTDITWWVGQGQPTMIYRVGVTL